MDLYISYAQRGRTTWWRYPLTLALGLLLATIALALLAAMLAALRLLPRDLTQQMQNPSDPWIFFASIAFIFAILGGGLAAAAALIQHKRPGDIIGAWRWQLFLAGVLIWLAVQVILAGIDFAITPPGFSWSGHIAPLLALWTFGAIMTQTFAEEFIFRGFITQGILLALHRPLPAAFASGVIFGALHISNGWPQAVNATAFGILWALIAIRTGGIALTFGMHLINNYFGAVVLVSANDVFKGSAGLITQNTPELMWWDAGMAIVAMLGILWLIAFSRIFRPCQIFSSAVNHTGAYKIVRPWR